MEATCGIRSEAAWCDGTDAACGNAEEGAWNRNPVLALCGHEVSRPKMMKTTPSCTKIHHDSSLTRSGTWQDDVLGIVRLFCPPPLISEAAQRAPYLTYPMY